ncbi:hypothetical protein BO95DRAFT_361797, partial [Aspergillus brunneoviolaceus CBS 621.78]
AHTTTGCGKQGFPSAQPYLSHTPGANPFCCMFLFCLPSTSVHTGLTQCNHELNFRIKNIDDIPGTDRAGKPSYYHAQCSVDSDLATK